MTETTITRCDASEIAAVLAQAVQPGFRLLLAKPLTTDVPSIAWVTTETLWKISLWRIPGRGLVETLDAVSPDHRCWERGCQRQWLKGGEVIDPLDSLSAEQREALDERLLRANLWPELDTCPIHVPGMEVSR